jgi:hypothetical protein
MRDAKVGMEGGPDMAIRIRALELLVEELLSQSLTAGHREEVRRHILAGTGGTDERGEQVRTLALEYLRRAG